MTGPTSHPVNPCGLGPACWCHVGLKPKPERPPEPEPEPAPEPDLFSGGDW